MSREYHAEFRRRVPVSGIPELEARITVHAESFDDAVVQAVLRFRARFGARPGSMGFVLERIFMVV